MATITVEEAREILGETSKKMTDEEIQKLIFDLDEIARLTLKALRDGTMKIPPEYKKFG